MDNTVSAYVFRLLKDKPDAQKIKFRYNRKDIVMGVEVFLNLYGLREVGLNGEIYSKERTLDVNNFIQCIL